MSNSEEKTEQVPKLNIKDITTIKRSEWESRPETTYLFDLMTLYSSQKRHWQKYDEEWALFELDHLKNAAPIPPSARFLLAHLLSKSIERSVREQKQTSSK